MRRTRTRRGLSSATTQTVGDSLTLRLAWHQWIYTTHSVVLPLFVTTVGPPLLPHLG